MRCKHAVVEEVFKSDRLWRAIDDPSTPNTYAVIHNTTGMHRSVRCTECGADLTESGVILAIHICIPPDEEPNNPDGGPA